MARHVLLDCMEVHNLWNIMVNWVGTSWAQPGTTVGHFVSFSNIIGDGKYKRRLGDLWICLVWVVWRWHNYVLFNGKE